MLHYLIRRLLIGCITLTCITFIIYSLIRNMPGDPATVAFNESDPSYKQDKAAAQRIKEQYHLDKPIYVGYFYWLGNLARGDLGRSTNQKQPVATAIWQRLGPTLFLSLASLVLALICSIPIGLISSARSGTPGERIVSTLLYMLYSFPAFVAALLLQYVFYLKYGVLPLERMHSDGYEAMAAVDRFTDILWHSILPIICYTYAGLAYESRFIRANMAEVLRQDYIRTARAKGVSGPMVIVKHAFRNTLIPMMTLLGLMLPGLLSGTVILEQIFSWPGMGLLFYDAIHARDYPLIMGLALLFSVMTLVGTLFSDVMYAVVDPRVTYS